MSRAPGYKTNVNLIVAAYAAIAAVLAIGLGHGLAEIVPGIGPQVSWLMAETTGVRVAALRAAGRPETAALYALLAAVSWSTIVALATGGFVWGVLTKGATVIGVDRALGYMTALAGLYGVSTLVELGMHALPPEITNQTGPHAIPAFWLFAMIASAAILARVGALIAHDVGTLLAIAADGDRERIAELVASAESLRGPKSFEARLARRMAALRLAE